MIKMKKWMLVILIVMGVFLAYILISLWISANYIVTREFEVDTGKCDIPVRAAVISDLHDHEFGKGNAALAEKILEAEPDLIIMDGDMLNNTSEDAAVPVELIERLSEEADREIPIYYAMGNHELEYINNGHPELTEQLEAAGASVLDERYEDIDINGVPIRLGGLYDYAFGLDGNNTAQNAPQDIFDFLMEYQDTDRLKIMLSHRPDSFIFGDASEVWDVDLVISGHNHGGQVVIPFLGGLYGGDQGWFPEYAHGVYEKGKFQMFVTSGLGSNRQKLPRFNNPPEAAVLTIR